MKKPPKNRKRTEHIPHIRIEPTLRAALDKYVQETGVTLSTAVHDMVAAHLVNAGYLVVEHVQVKPPVEELRYILPEKKDP